SGPGAVGFHLPGPVDAGERLGHLTPVRVLHADEQNPLCRIHRVTVKGGAGGQQQPGVGQHAPCTAPTPQRSGARQAACLAPGWGRTPDGVTSASRTGYWETAPCSYSTSTGIVIEGKRGVPIWMTLASLVVSSRWSVSSATQTCNTQAEVERFVPPQ